MKNALLITGCLLSLLSLQAQKREEGFDYAFKPTDGAPRYYVITEKKDTLWHREAYYLPERSMAMDAWYKDSAAKVPHGTYNWYHPSRYTKTTGKYVDGKKEGAWLTFDEAGHMTDSSFYVNNRRKGISLGWNAEGYLTDSSNFDGAGNGVDVSWYQGGTVRSAGRWINDTTKQGRWQYFHANGKLQASEDYIDGKMTACNCFTEEGKPLAPKDCEGREAIIEGGDRAWTAYMQRYLQADVPVKAGAPAGNYTVVIQFVVNTDGSLIDIKPRTGFGYGMEEEVQRLIKKSPKWIPAQQFGKKVKAYRLQPITFVVSER